MACREAISQNLKDRKEKAAAKGNAKGQQVKKPFFPIGVYPIEFVQDPGRRSLINIDMGCLFCNFRNKLNGAGPGSNNRDALSA